MVANARNRMRGYIDLYLKEEIIEEVEDLDDLEEVVEENSTEEVEKDDS